MASLEEWSLDAEMEVAGKGNEGAWRVEVRKQARKLQATLVRNYDSPTYLLTRSQG